MVRRAFEEVEKVYQSFDHRPLIDSQGGDSHLSSVLAGGLSPLIATYLLKRLGAWPVALYVLGMAIVTTVSVLVATEPANQEIHEEIKEKITTEPVANRAEGAAS
jgi:hypothetical protein